MRIALHDLQLDRLVVLYPGTATYPLADNVEAVPIAALGARDANVLLGERRRAK
ncbi:MAG TPA: hypothetical protein VJR89_11380 [Polyangiales bacterium]|nr:hypothetical protein [Polyangiales bacterium]